MSLATLMQRAATEAQKTLAELGGAAPGQKNSLYNGAKYYAVYGAPQIDHLNLAGGGSRQRTFLLATATRSQFTSPPIAQRGFWIRTDISPQIRYTIVKVMEHDAYTYVLTLQRSGE